jgi:hypothetical protein
MEACPR